MKLAALMKVSSVPLFLLAACGSNDDVPGHDALVQHVKNGQIGGDKDQWIEMNNSAGEWEKTGLIFGYIGDHEECLKAIAGLKKQIIADSIAVHPQIELCSPRKDYCNFGHTLHFEL